ncbi:hypothetical protein Droror1_Dr00009208 [Drosera rotundifolia]
MTANSVQFDVSMIRLDFETWVRVIKGDCGCGGGDAYRRAHGVWWWEEESGIWGGEKRMKTERAVGGGEWDLGRWEEDEDREGGGRRRVGLVVGRG